MWAEQGVKPSEFRPIPCGTIIEKDLDSGDWTPVFCFNKDNLIDWNKACEMAESNDAKVWEFVIGPALGVKHDSSLYRRSASLESNNLHSLN